LTGLALDLQGGQVLLPEVGLAPGRVSIADGVVCADTVGRRVDLSGYLVLPGIVDLHGDGFELHLAPRRGAMKQMSEGVIATAAELAANGITTGVMAQFWSWEGGLRSPDYAGRVFEAIRAARPHVVTDLIAQLRFETHMLDDHDTLPEKVAQWQVPYVVFNDHLPHDRLAAGKTPARLTGQALKAGRNPQRHLEMMAGLHAQRDAVPASLERLAARLQDAGVLLGSHDDQSAADRARARAMGLRIAEFPETVEAAEAARAGGDRIVLGAPNVVRGGSHKGNASALDLIVMGLCDALASDYHYPSPRRAAVMLAQTGAVDFAAAWALVSAGPAAVLGLADRGALVPGKRADIVILEADSHRVAATLSRGRFSYLSGDVAERFMP
jgi:alpha-D-ribose 1-methylphosphonate 5-triphosphate diphosphatase